MKLSLIGFSCLITLSFASCVNCIQGVGEITEEKRTIEDYDVLYVNCSANVTIRQIGLNEINKVTVRAQENLLPFIHSTIDGKRLVLEYEGCIEPSEPVAMEIATNGLIKIVQNGSGRLETIGTIKAEDFRIDLEGSGEILAKYKGEELDVANRGSGNIDLIGDCNELRIELDGSGDVNALELKANDVQIALDGSGNVSAFARKAIEIELNGSGNVRYKGSPQDIVQKVNGSGSVEKLD